MRNPVLSSASRNLEKRPARSAWARGVAAFAAGLLQDLDDGIADGWIDAETLYTRRAVERAMLNGADDWRAYSWGGCGLIYNGDIARALCNPSELAKTDGGRKRPNAREDWLDVQARALYQAARLAMDCIDEALKH